eukprot:11081555-Ditylum_brightwellii.AAC.1
MSTLHAEEINAQRELWQHEYKVSMDEARVLVAEERCASVKLQEELSAKDTELKGLKAKCGHLRREKDAAE